MIEVTSVADAISMLFGDSVTITEKRPVQGGDINRAYQLTLSNDSKIFLKCNRPEDLPFFIAEASGLDALRRTNTIGVPEPLSVAGGDAAVQGPEVGPLDDRALGGGGGEGDAQLDEAGPVFDALLL